MTDDVIRQVQEYLAYSQIRDRIRVTIPNPEPRRPVPFGGIGAFFLATNSPRAWRASTEDRHYLAAFPPRDPVPTLQELDETFRRYANR